MYKFSDFYFSSYREKFIENWGDKMTITRKIKIGNLIFLSIQPIPDLSCKFDNFWRNFILIHMYPCMQKWRLFLNAVDTNQFRLGSTHPKKNSQTLDVILWSGAKLPIKKKIDIFSFKLNFLCSKLFWKTVVPQCRNVSRIKPYWLCHNDGHADPPLKKDQLKKVVMNGAECSE